MKNFLETLDTNQTLEVLIKIKVVDNNGYPDFTLLLNNKKLVNNKQKTFFFKEIVHYNDNLFFTIKMYGKKYSATKESAVIVEEITIDGFNIIPAFNHCIEYHNEKNESITTNYIGYNGVWELNINRPFYQWYHQITSQGMLI